MDRESDGKIGGELLNELFSAFEDMETQSAGILQFLKAKGLATDQELAPHLQQAADASNVRWLAARVRMDALLAAAIKDAEEEFAGKMEERARARDKSTAQKDEGRHAPRKKGTSNAALDGPKMDASEKDAAEQAQAPRAGTEETVGAKKEEGGTKPEVPAAKPGPESEDKPSDAAEENTDQNAA